MAVKMRLARAGAKKSPFYRVVVANSRSPRDGRFIEHIGVYDPTRTPTEVRFKMDRVDYWLSQGAEPSETVAFLISQVKTGKLGTASAAK
ncbi:MAG: 30S ribosomal protein S16 [Polyangia bacterium]|jgi:small subunit ribosomal protein S16